MRQNLLTAILLLNVLLYSRCTPGKDDPAPVTPPLGQKNIAAVDNVIQQFMSSFNVPGVSIAVARDDKLVYAKSYGKMSSTDPTPVTNKSLFRIASVSKPITSVAIMKLIEAGKLSLDSKVFGDGGILGNDYPTAQINNILDITIRQLLQHTTGGWENTGADPMFQLPSYGQQQLILWTLDNYPNPPSKRGLYRYSNFGYCLLGRVIEKIAGRSYEQFVKDEVLSPCGISSMQIAGNTLSERKQDEVIYSGQGGENPYIHNITRLDAAGGWIATATDLARFVVRVNGMGTKQDILQPSTITTMTTRSLLTSNYACGWQVNNFNNWWHIGSLPGSASEIIRTNNGYTWVFLCNTRGDVSFLPALDRIWWDIANANPNWEDVDLF